MRLDLALIRLHPHLSRRRARDVIEKGQVLVDQNFVREAGASVQEGATIVWDPNKKALSRARLSLPLLYEDEGLLIVDKPAGLLAVPSSPDATDEDTVLRRVKEFVGRRAKHPYVGIVHRIDRDTSGAILFALSHASRMALRPLFREHRIERRYAALVWGEPRDETGVVDLPIHEAYVRGRRRVALQGEPGRSALTKWTVAERLEGAALLHLELGTGRQHQIRVHLAQIGFPILGDTIYGPAKRLRSPPVRRQMLHARVLAFVHPLTGARIRAESPLPADFERVLAALRRRAQGSF